jgi:undecaprenyl-diphosphatase
MQALDFALFRLVNAGASAPGWGIGFAIFASDVLPAMLALAVAAGAVFDRRWRSAFFTALVSVLLVWVIANAFRSLVPLPRPAFYGLGIQWVPQGIRPGFPSLHTAGCFAAAFSLLSLPWRAPMGVALLVAAVVGWSRLYLGVHFPSDVAAATILGALVAVAVERGISRPLGLALSKARWVDRLRSRVRPGPEQG